MLLIEDKVSQKYISFRNREHKLKPYKENINYSLMKNIRLLKVRYCLYFYNTSKGFNVLA